MSRRRHDQAATDSSARFSDPARSKTPSPQREARVLSSAVLPGGTWHDTQPMPVSFLAHLKRLQLYDGIFISAGLRGTTPRYLVCVFYPSPSPTYAHLCVSGTQSVSQGRDCSTDTAAPKCRGNERRGRWGHVSPTLTTIPQIAIMKTTSLLSVATWGTKISALPRHQLNRGRVFESDICGGVFDQSRRASHRVQNGGGTIRGGIRPQLRRNNFPGREQGCNDWFDPGSTCTGVALGGGQTQRV